MWAFEQILTSLSKADEMLCAKLCTEFYNQLEYAVETSSTNTDKRELLFYVLQSLVAMMIVIQGEPFQEGLKTFKDNVQKMLDNLDRQFLQATH